MLCNNHIACALHYALCHLICRWKSLKNMSASLYAVFMGFRGFWFDKKTKFCFWGLFVYLFCVNENCHPFFCSAVLSRFTVAHCKILIGPPSQSSASNWPCTLILVASDSPMIYFVMFIRSADTFIKWLKNGIKKNWKLALDMNCLSLSIGSDCLQTLVTFNHLFVTL